MKTSSNFLKIEFNNSTLEDFLQGKGWTFKKNQEENTVFFSPPDSSNKRLSYLISKDTSDDFYDLSYQLLRGVARVERCEPSSTFEEFQSYLANAYNSIQSAIKLKFGGASTNSISLQEAETIARHSRLLIAHAIDNEKNPCVSRGKASKDASSISQSFEVNQSQRGSYIFVIRTPHEIEQRVFAGLDPETPIHTKAILRLAKGMQWISENGDKVDNYQEVSRAAEFGINANMALHLSELFEAVNTTEKYFTFNINSKFIANQPIKQLSFKVAFREIDYFKNIHSILTEPREEIMEFPVKILKLHSNNPLQESLSHKVTIIVEDSDSSLNSRQISMELTKDLYLKAYAAHGNAESLTLKAKFKIAGTKVTVKEIYSLT